MAELQPGDQMKRHNIINVHPGRILKEDVIIPAGLSLSDAAERLRISQLTLSKILDQEGAITPELAIQISRVFGGKQDFWLRMQKRFDSGGAERPLG